MSTGVSWSYDDPGLHSEDFTYLVRIVAADDSVTAAASQDVRIDQTPPAAVITIDATIGGDGIINDAESSQPVVVTGEVSGDVNVGDLVTLTVGGETYEGLVFEESGTLTYAIEVPGADLTNNADLSMSASITPIDDAGNVGATAEASQSYAVDTVVEAVISVDYLPDENTIATRAYRGLDVTVTGAAGATLKRRHRDPNGKRQ